MDLKIVYITAEKIIGEERWIGTFSDAKDVAERTVKAGVYDRVEILNEHGATISSYPRLLKKA